jgi:hypothetical protein
VHGNLSRGFLAFGRLALECEHILFVNVSPLQRFDFLRAHAGSVEKQNEVFQIFRQVFVNGIKFGFLKKSFAHVVRFV